jgi:polyisoprenoid-binding protein YceI
MTTTQWNLDAAHSSIGFSIRHMFSKVRGRFATFTGVVNFDDADLTRSAAEISIDASSIDTGTSQRDGHLRSPDFFDVEKFPKIQFRSTRIEKVEDTRYRVVGDLTMHSVTREVSLDVEYAGRGKDPWGNERVAFAGKTSLDRREFGLQWNQALEAGNLLVGDKVEIEIDLQAVKAAAEKAA